MWLKGKVFQPYCCRFCLCFNLYQFIFLDSSGNDVDRRTSKTVRIFRLKLCNLTEMNFVIERITLISFTTDSFHCFAIYRLQSNDQLVSFDKGTFNWKAYEKENAFGAPEVLVLDMFETYLKANDT